MRVPSRYSHEITNIFSFPNSLAMFVPVLLAACWYYPSTRVCLLLELPTAKRTVHTAKWTVHTGKCTVHTRRCTLHTAKCALRAAHCSLHTRRCTLHCEMPDARILNFATKAATVWTEETGENPSTMQNLHPPWLVLFQIRRFITVFTLLSFF